MEQEDNIQNMLESAGNGLPGIDAKFLRYIIFPILKTCLSWNMGMRLFEYEGRRILSAAKILDSAILFERVLISKTFGIEDNSRYYSPAMVLWHLKYVGEAIQEGIIGLSNNEALDFVVKIENFKPFVEIDKNIVEEYESFLTNYRNSIERKVGDRFANNYHTHPWFGPMNPHQWLIMSALHQIVHGRQLRKIIRTHV